MIWASEKSALAFAQGQVGLDHPGQAQRPVGAGDRQQPGVRAGGLGQRAGIQDEGRLAHQRQASRHDLPIENLYVKVKEKMRLPSKLLLLGRKA